MLRPLLPLTLLTCVLATAASAAEPETFRLCTGTPGKTYHAVGETLQTLTERMSAGQLALELVSTQGSIDNLTRIVEGECDGAIVQGDAVQFFTSNVRPEAKGRFRLQTPLYQELSFLLCSRESGIKEIDDLLSTKNASVAAGAMGSGSLATWLTFRSIKPAYAKVPVIPENGAAGALAVAQGRASCLFEVIGPQSDFITALDQNAQIGDKLRFAEVDDGFSGYKIDGQPVYTRVEFDDDQFQRISAWGDPEVIAIMAYLVLAEDWASRHPQALGTLSMTLLTGQADIEKIAYGDRKPFAE